MAKSKLWFAAKKYGYGWYPNTWQGWFVLLGYLVIFAPAVMFVKQNPIFSFSIIFIDTIILLFICVKKGEKAKWRWG